MEIKCEGIGIKDDTISVLISNFIGNDMVLTNLSFEKDNISCSRTFNKTVANGDTIPLYVDNCDINAMLKDGILDADMRLDWHQTSATAGFSHAFRGRIRFKFEK